jgi:hypothetical protein
MMIDDRRLLIARLPALRAGMLFNHQSSATARLLIGPEIPHAHRDHQSSIINHQS